MAKKNTRKVRGAIKARPKGKDQNAAKSARTASRPVSKTVIKNVASQNRAEGLRLFMLAGRPTAEQFILVYGDRGTKMTWAQRAAAGIPANRFQAALAAKVRK